MKILKGLMKFLKKNIKKIIIVSIIIGLSVFGYFQYSKRVDKFTQDGERKIVYFYLPECPHCVQFSPIWELFKQKIGNYEGLRFEKVNAEEQSEVAEKYSINSFPTIVYMKNDKILDIYKRNRNVQDLTQWAKQDLPKL
jgi:thiol-disulfide isomerase/thioredoxin